MQPKSQNGSALFVTLIILALLMILGTSTLTSSMVDLKMAGNTRQTMDSFQKADAGVSATMSLEGGANDPFEGHDDDDDEDPFAGFSVADHPLKNVTNTNETVTVATSMTGEEGDCERAEDGSSDIINCEFFQINSTHTKNGTGLSATVIQGVRREIIARN